MRDLCSYDYAIVRVVPRVEREEFINVGVIVSCPGRNFLDACVEVDEQRLTTLYPELDMPTLHAHLASIPIICRGAENSGPIGQLTQRERFHWLVAPRSTIIQISAVHAGRCRNPADALNHLLATMVQLPVAI